MKESRKKKMKGKTIFSHNTDDWRTPAELYIYFMKFCEDPCPYKSDIDNLKKLYKNKELYINPPYSKIDKWTEFIYMNAWLNKIYLLIPARTDTKYFHTLMKLNPIIIFIKGRLKFNDTGSAPFPSILLLFGFNNKQNYFYVENIEDLKKLVNILRSDK